MTRKLFILAACLSPFAFAAPASAASFDCGRADSPDERTICANRFLNDKDVQLALLYDIVPRLVPMGTRGTIRDEQVEWLRDRGRCGASIACLERAYDRRIAQLRAIIDERVVPHGPF